MDAEFESPKDKVTRSAAEFNKALNALGDHLQEQFQLVATGCVLRTWKEIIARTPVDTGRARANWQVGSEVNGQTIGEKTKSTGKKRTTPPRRHAADPKMPQGHARKQLVKSDVKWIFSNLPYIEPLEAGHSQQAPAGMVAESLQMMGNFLKEELRRVKS